MSEKEFDWRAEDKGVGKEYLWKRTDRQTDVLRLDSEHGKNVA